MSRRSMVRTTCAAWSVGLLAITGCVGSEGRSAMAEGDVLAASESGPMELGAEPVTVEVPLSAEANERLLAAEPGRLRLAVEGVRLLRPGLHYQVYLNLPADAAADPGSPRFLGHLVFFAEPGATGETSRTFDLAPAVRALHARGEWTGEVWVTFVPDAQALGEDAAAGGPFFRIRRVAVLGR